MPQNSVTIINKKIDCQAQYQPVKLLFDKVESIIKSVETLDNRGIIYCQKPNKRDENCQEGNCKEKRRSVFINHAISMPTKVQRQQSLSLPTRPVELFSAHSSQFLEASNGVAQQEGGVCL